MSAFRNHRFRRANTEREAFFSIDQYISRLMQEMNEETETARTFTEIDESILYMRYLRETMMEYNANMQQFLHTMDTLEQHMYNRNEIRHPRRAQAPHRRPEPVYTVPLNDTRANTTRPRPTQPYQNSVFYRTLRAFIPNFQDVVVRPTQEQIENATEQFVFRSSEDQTHTRCPITLEDFQDGDNVTRIRQCGHTFQNAGLSNWFTSNVRCPVCRYDIREWTPHVDEHTDEPSAFAQQTEMDAHQPHSVTGEEASGERDETTSQTSRINSLINEITSGLNNAIQTHISTEYNRNSYRHSELHPDTTLYTFNIPLIYEDSFDLSNVTLRAYM